MIKTINITRQKITALASLALLAIVLILSASPARVLAAAPAAADYSKNFLYTTPCVSGTKGADLHVIASRSDKTPIACVRLRGDNVGYSIAALPAPNGVVANNACVSSGGVGGSGSASTVYTVDALGFGIVCVTNTDASKWDTTDFSPPPAPKDTTADLSCANGASSGNCILFKKYLIPAINFLSIGVGIVVIVMVIIGGIQYSTAGGNAQAVAAARSRIFNAILALLAYIFLWAFLQWIVPGGIL